MSLKDLDAVVPASNDADEDDDGYEVVSDDSSDEETDDNSSKKSSSKPKPNTSGKQKVRQKKRKLPSRKVMSGKKLPPLQTADPAKHALEPMKPIIVKQKIDNAFDKEHMIDLSNEAQTGIAYRSKTPPDYDPLKETFDQEPFYKRKWVHITALCVLFVICLIGVFFYCRRKYLMQRDPLNQQSVNQQSVKESTEKKDDEPPQNLNVISGGNANSSKLPPSYENSYYDDVDESIELTAAKVGEDVPKSAIKKDSKKDVKVTETKSKSNELPKRDARGRFVKRN